ncbi:FadR/GntR family transcriptional regulator [Halalkalibacter oceani]|uniref:FadR family transcriptional regulator n=1 Tax=Halalkalibacter oceani TaxID=1653776 RepID=A0A9X2DPN9_9BACI|nr:FadR/GntR family transcriptional regulator [Halalkalibacter oceani]MCM3714791.1 FadR family transcriptional regulator [Halalkalibacter oceani]
MFFKPIEKKEKLYVKIADQINKAIQEGNFKIGDKLPAEREISAQLGVSRASVREALAVLEIMNIIEIRVGDGSYIKNKASNFDFEIKKMKNSSAYELIEARIHIETLVTKLAIERATEQDIADIEHTVVEMRRLINDEDQLEEFFKYGAMFHTKIAEATHNEILTQIATSLLEQSNHPLWGHLNMKAILNYEVRLHQLQEHEGILEAMKQKDMEKAEEMMAHHLEHLTNLIFD